ncbi:MAG: IS110 family transposase [Flavobacteriaceae bacterium]|nr:IS110 family transposase [Flavobacteriaceae bacterium]
MVRNNNFFGIDISKDVFDVVKNGENHYQFSNNTIGFKKFIKLLDDKPCCIMEATGVYHYSLAMYLYQNKIAVSVVNPLVIKRFIQMHLKTIKTDKADAKQISLYGMQNKLPLWKPSESYISESKDLFELASLYIKQRTMLKNRLHSFGRKSTQKLIKTELNKSIRQLDRAIKKIETELEIIIKTYHQKMYANLKSIPGLGSKTVLYMILITDGFEKFESPKQLCSYAGLAPTQRISGSSIRGKSRISKQGNSKLRNLLFMCSFNACKVNKSCKALYDRLVAKGKSKKLALIAVENKLIKQAFSIAKSGLKYDENFVSVKPTYS